MTNISSIIKTFDTWLKPHLFRDYCPNGLQVEGDRNSIHTLACAVTASQSVIEQAIAKDADILLVHHGIFWKGDSPIISGSRKKRIKLLLSSGIHLVAYHLPLDAHPVLGNNARLAVELDFDIEGSAENKPDSLLYLGNLKQPASASQLCFSMEQKLKRKPLLLGDANKKITKIAWCTGAAQGYFDQAIDLGVDAYLTGEVSEQNYHQAQESKCCFIAAGHHATERYGVQQLACKISEQYHLKNWFIDQHNPV